MRVTIKNVCVRGGRGAGIFPRIVGDHARMLDLLHASDSAAVRGVGAWHGGRRVLAGGAGAEIAVGESPPGCGGAGSGRGRGLAAVHCGGRFLTFSS